MDKLVELYEKNRHSNKVYMDNSATTMVDYEVINDMLPYFVSDYGNPSNNHTLGNTAKQGILKAKQQIAKLINCSPEEIYFTSGGTESNNWVLNGVVQASEKPNKNIITSKIEHKSILNTCKNLADRQLCGTKYINVDSEGFVDLQELEQSITDNTILVSIMYANNEVGTIQDIEKIRQITKDKNIYLHTDVIQIIGKQVIDVKQLDVDFMTFSGHKIHAPKGIGVLYIKDGIDIKPFIHGGSQQNGQRGGTENVPAIVGLGKACEILYHNQDIYNIRIKEYQDYMIERLKQIPDVIVTGSLDKRVNSIISICVKRLSGNAIVLALDTCGVECSSGSACNEKTITKSHVLEAMKISDDYIKGSVRFSISKYTTLMEIKYTISKLNTVINTLKTI